MILENEDMVEKVAGTTFDRMLPTSDLLLLTDNLYAEITESSPTVTAQ